MKNVIIFIGILLALFCGCARKIYVPVESVTVRTDTLYQSRLRVDTMRMIERVYEADFRHDSIAPILDSLGRVLGWERWHFRELTKKDSREIERLQAVIDSLRAVKRDSIDRPVPYPVERELTKWERVKMDAGGFAFSLLAAIAVMGLIALLIWLIKIKRRK